MEALLFLLGPIAIIVMIIMDLRDDRRPPGTPRTSIFRTFEGDVVCPDAATGQAHWDDRIARNRAR